MPNLSYCRFRNTLRDLRDCLDFTGDDDLSTEEDKARRALLKAMGAEVFGALNKLNGPDHEAFNEIVDYIHNGADDDDDD